MIELDQEAFLNNGKKCEFVYVPARPSRSSPMTAAATGGWVDFGDCAHWKCKTHDARIDRPKAAPPFWRDCADVRTHEANERARREEESLAREARAKKAERAIARAVAKARRYVRGVVRALKGDVW